MFSWPLVKSKAKDVQIMKLLYLKFPLGKAVFDLFGVLKSHTHSINLKGLEYSVIKESFLCLIAYSVKVTTKTFNYVKSVLYKFFALFQSLSNV